MTNQSLRLIQAQRHHATCLVSKIVDDIQRHAASRRDHARWLLSDQSRPQPQPLNQTRDGLLRVQLVALLRSGDICQGWVSTHELAQGLLFNDSEEQLSPIAFVCDREAWLRVQLWPALLSLPGVPYVLCQLLICWLQ